MAHFFYLDEVIRLKVVLLYKLIYNFFANF